MCTSVFTNTHTSFCSSSSHLLFKNKYFSDEPRLRLLDMKYKRILGVESKVLIAFSQSESVLDKRDQPMT